ncbi:MAG TPA: DUF3086 domain-containing protein [Oscillatoriales cyanobacterium M59_W2019_021]|nr:DUF3086 domain-containing protein [Oscillatoriales cyanobacterium M4454_W2019_049]HIK51407.1 DUF3086 domain-containing protein [Oscillatoriales cyanobacterium M59_W2019_021]
MNLDAASTPDPQSNDSKDDRKPTTPEPPIDRATPISLTPKSRLESITPKAESSESEGRIGDLRDRVQTLKDEIRSLQAAKFKAQQERDRLQADLARLVEDSLSDLQQRRQALQLSIEQLERREERIRQEMRTTFAGASQELAMRVQGFKEYLVGSLQELASTAEQLELAPPEPEPEPVGRSLPPEDDFAEPEEDIRPQFTRSRFQDQTQQIRRLLDEYRYQPDYYAPPWQLRRTFEPIHAERVSNWLFAQGGRGALRSMGSRLQNILIASAAISVLYSLYDRRLCTLVLANSPERLGEWRRGLQDCLGIDRTDFGPDRGVGLFEEPEPLVQKADRLVRANRLPLILIDESEDFISLSLLQFPLWLAFAPAPPSELNPRDRDW